MIKHVLKDGSRPQDITGHVVKKEDAADVYAAIRRRRKDAKQV